MNRSLKRILAFIISFAMIATMLPMANVYATEANLAAEDVENVECPIESISFETKDIVCGTEGYYTIFWDENDNELEYFYYDEYSFVTGCTATMKNGDIVEGDRWSIEYEGEEYEIYYSSDQSYENQWGAGRHEITASVLGYETTFEVEITESPIESISFETKNVTSGSKGYYDWDYDENDNEIKYFRYEEASFISGCTATMKNGDIVEGDRWSIEYEGKEYDINYSSDQSYKNQWDTGTHEITASVLGYETTLNVEIIESPIESVSFETKDVIYGTEGYYDTYWTEEDDQATYYKYEESSFISGCTATMKNGDVVKGTPWSIEYEGEEYEISCSSDQSYDNQWGVGKHKITASVPGYETTLDVEIIESPVTKVEYTIKPIYEETNGDYDWDYDDWNEIRYFKYDEAAFISGFVVTLKGGDVIKGSGDSFEYEDTEYSIDFKSDQSANTPWGVGKHEITVNLLGYESTVEVEIYECPIESISFETKDIPQYTCGYKIGSGEDEISGGWYEYNDFFTKYTIKMKNGNIIESKKDSFNYEGNRYYITFDTDQSSDNQWDVGKHEVTVSVMGYTTSFTVNITESLYKSIEVLNVEELTETASGEYKYPEISCKITKRDGTSFIQYLNHVNDDEYFLNNPEELIMHKDGEWCAGGDNLLILEYAGMQAKVNVTIIPASEFDYTEQNGKLYITAYNGSESVVEIPKEIDGKAVKGILSLDNFTGKELVVPDSVEQIAALGENETIKKISLGASVNNITSTTFKKCLALESIQVSDDSPNYCSIDGVIYNKSITRIVSFPPAKTGTYLVPKTVTNIDILNDYVTEDLTVSFEEGSNNFITSDGVTYSADKTKVLFCDKEKAGSYTMPESVTQIASGAFRNCDRLTDVSISNKVTSITYENFANCTSLKSVKVPKSVKSIEKAAFIDSGIADVGTLEGVATIDEMAFMRTPIKNIGFSDALKTIGSCAFYYTELDNVTLPESLETVGDYAFAHSKLGSIKIPDSVTELGEAAFADNRNMISAVVGSGVDNIKANTFIRCTDLVSVDLKGSNVSIGEYAFCYTSLEDINLENVDNIGIFAFKDSKLTDIKLKEGVTDITYGSFMNSSDLEEITLPSSIESVDAHAFDGTTWYDKQENGITYIGSILYAVKGAFADKFEAIINDGTTVLGNVAFEEQSGLTKIALPDGLKTIGAGTFTDCINLEELTIPSSVSRIGDFAFKGCESLKKINVAADNEHYKTINGALYNKDGSVLIWSPPVESDTLVIPCCVKTIKVKALGDSGTKNIVISNENTTIEENVWYKELYYGVFDPKEEYGNVVIHCVEDSPAHTFAKKHNLKVQFIEGSQHEWNDDYTVDKEATCTVEGSKSIHCSVCDAKKDITTIDKLAHSFGNWEVTTTPTCTENGEKTRICACGEKETKPVDKLAHDMQEHTAVEATCEDDGNITYYTCDVCEKYFLDEKGTTETTAREIVVEATGHKFGTYRTRTKAKFGKNGSQYAKCTACTTGYDYKDIAAPKTIKLSYTEYTYNGKIKKPTVKAVYDSEGNKISSANYKVSYASGRKNVGKYKVTVTFNKNSASYTGSSSTTFKINPKGTSISKLTKAKKGFTVKWKKQAGKMAKTRITGYQYRYSTSSKMTNATIKTVKGYGKTSAKKTSLKAKKKYYVQVRTYKTVNGTKYYSPWSKSKSVTTK